MYNLEPRDRVVARKLLRLMRRDALIEEKNYIEAFAKRLGIRLDQEPSTAEERDLMRACPERRPGRTKGLRRGFAG